jgi:hypothetical protein
MSVTGEAYKRALLAISANPPRTPARGATIEVMAINAGRYTADVGDRDDEIVVFLIGMRVNKPWLVRKWWPVFRAMPRMLRYLDQHPEHGLLGWRLTIAPALAFEPTIVQYWRSFADLERFARDKDDPHLEAWRAFNRAVGKSGDVGIWHETYVVKRSAIDTIYSNMPAYGLAKATAAVPIRNGKQSAAARAGQRETDEPALPAY